MSHPRAALDSANIDWDSRRHDPGRPRQAAGRGRRDVRRRRRPLRPHQRRALPRPGPALAPRRRPGRGLRPGSGCSTSPPAPGPRPSRSLAAGARRRRLRLLARHARAGPAKAGPTRRLLGRRRARAAVRRRVLRRGDDLLRAAQRRRRRGRPARAAPGDPAGRPAGRVRVQPPDLGAVPGGLRGVPDARAALGGPPGVASNPDAYVYLAESIRAWPDQAGLAARIAAAGWTRWPGATSPAASSPCTGRPAPGRAA